MDEKPKTYGSKTFTGHLQLWYGAILGLYSSRGESIVNALLNLRGNQIVGAATSRSLLQG